MAEKDKRPEATHRERMALGASELPIGDDGRPMAVIAAGASDLIPTVQFGNILLSCVVTRAVPDDGVDDDAMVVQARRVAKIAQSTVGSERRILQWAIDPSKKVMNPSGSPVPDAPSSPAPEPAAAPQAGDVVEVTATPQDQAGPSIPKPPAA